MNITLDAAGIQWLHDNRLFFSMDSIQQRLRPGDVLQFADDLEVEPYAAILGGLHICPIGSFSYSWSPLPIDMGIGRYTSIAAGLSVPGPRHAIDKLSTSSFMYDGQFSIFHDFLEDMGGTFGNFQDNPQKPAPILGSDVWIGEACVLMPGITIGDGAVVAAHAVVTKDVAPFTIVGGNPAEPIRPRFGDDVIAKLIQGEWWRYSFKDFDTLPLGDPAAFADRFLEVKDMLMPWDPAPICLSDLATINPSGVR